ncbi:MAG: zinc ribbon domain-containing protein [Nitrospirota bacterium]
MPIYEYACTRCKESFSVYQSITARESDTKCPKCGANEVKKKLSSFSCCPTGGGSSLGSGFGRGFGGG